MARKDQAFTSFRNTTTPPPIVALYGSDSALVSAAVSEAASILRTALGPSTTVTALDFDELNRDAGVLLDHFSEPSLFADPKLLVCSGLTERGQKLVRALLETLPDDLSGAAALFASSALKSRSATLDLFRSSPQAACVSVYSLALSREDIETRLRRLDVLPDAAAVSALERIVAPLDSLTAGKMLEKAALLADGEGALSAAALSEGLDAAESGADDDLVAPFLVGDAALLIQSFQTRHRSGEDPIGFLLLFSRSVQSLRTACRDLGEGRPARGLFWKNEGPLKSAMKRLRQPLDRFDQAILAIFSVERALRNGQSRIDPKLEVERLLLRCARLFR